MRIQQLHYIIKIVETGSMNEAAKQLFITQPSLSNAVRDLEREMGIDIFIRNPKGITLTKDGVEFLSYARQVVEQTNLLEERYKSHTETRELFSVSSQHYAFVVNAFVSLLKRADMTRYELFLRETRTYEIIEDVKNFRSEIGVLKCLTITDLPILVSLKLDLISLSASQILWPSIKWSHWKI